MKHNKLRKQIEYEDAFKQLSKTENQLNGIDNNHIDADHQLCLIVFATIAIGVIALVCMKIFE